MGAIDHSELTQLMTSEHTTSGLILALNYTIHKPFITGFFSFFSSICVITAFLGVSLGLFDFLADGLALKKEGYQGKSALALTFLPPLIVVLIIPGLYIQAFRYAGICCLILLLLLPSAMAWQARKNKLSNQAVLLRGGNFTLITLAIITFLLLFISN